MNKPIRRKTGKLLVSKYNDTDFRAIDIEYKHARECLIVLWCLSEKQINGLMKHHITAPIRKLFGELIKPSDLEEARQDEKVEISLVQQLNEFLPEELALKLWKASIRAEKKQKQQS